MGPSSASRWLAFLVVACGSFCSTGCTLIGAAVGSAVPRWEHGVSSESITREEKERGEPLEAVPQFPWLLDGPCDVRRGTYVAVGAGVGALIDVTLVVLVAVMYVNNPIRLNGMSLGKYP